EGITLVVNQNARIDVTLSVGQTSEVVNVTAQPPDVDTHSATTGEVVDHTRIQELPLNGRNAMALARVAPGVLSFSGPTVATNGRNGPGITVAGGRVTQDEFRLDGTIHTALQHLTASTILRRMRYRISRSSPAEPRRSTAGIAEAFSSPSPGREPINFTARCAST